jgi:hypothetical protein
MPLRFLFARDYSSGLLSGMGEGQGSVRMKEKVGWRGFLVMLNRSLGLSMV